MHGFPHRVIAPERKGDIGNAAGNVGMGQVGGRSDMPDSEEIVKLDLEYIDNWSLLLDIKILFKTVFIVLGRKGSK